MTQAFAHATPRTAVRTYATRRDMRLALIATFPFFLAATLMRRLNPFSEAPPAHPSVLAETRARASAIIPFIFMG